MLWEVPGEKTQNHFCPRNGGSAPALSSRGSTSGAPAHAGVVSNRNLWAAPLIHRFHFPAFLSTFQRGISLGLVEAFPHRNQLHLELALPPCIARGEEPDGSAAATAPKFSLGKLRESLWALLLEHDTNKNPQKGEMQPEPPGISGELPQSELQHPITPHHSDLKHLGKRQHVKTVSIRQIL